mgnify:CR=1 FL=1
MTALRLALDATMTAQRRQIDALTAYHDALLEHSNAVMAVRRVFYATEKAGRPADEDSEATVELARSHNALFRATETMREADTAVRVADDAWFSAIAGLRLRGEEK